MRSICYSIFLFIFLLFQACGEAGVGFNISKEIPITFQSIAIKGLNQSNLVNPPSFSKSFELKEVPDFDDVLSNLAETDAIRINSIAYSLNGVSTEEEVKLDELSVSTKLASGELVKLFSITDALKNIDKTMVTINKEKIDELKETLSETKGLNSTLTIDFAEIPSSDIEFDFTIFIDITLRVRL